MEEARKITEVLFELEGIVPLKMDRYHGLPDPKTKDGYIKQAEEKCYRNDDGELVIPANAVKAVMRLASSDLGKKMEAKKNRQLIASGVFFEEENFSLGRKNHDGLILDLVTRKGIGDKVTRVITYRPIVKKWKISGKMFLMDIQLQFARQCLDLGGLRYGLLGHRPEFGRYNVNKFEAVEG